jgi:hypothetical protein
LTNHLTKNTAIDGYVFLPTGPDLEFVRSQPMNKVWSFIVCDGWKTSIWVISDGMHVVNLMGYLVTRHASDPIKTYSIRY